MSTTDTIKSAVPVSLAVVGLAIACSAMYDCGKKSASNEIADLSTKLAESEHTIEIGSDTFATTIVENSHLKDLLSQTLQAKQNLMKILDETQAQLLTTQQVAVKWKNAYEAELSAHQGDGGSGQGSDGQPTERKRVDFAGDLGPIHAAGYTLTDPAEAHLKLDQLRPLILSVSVARNRDGKWQSYVTSSEPNMTVDVNLAGVDPGVVAPSWKQRIWAEGGIGFLVGQEAHLGLSYHLDRYSLGAYCSVFNGGDACGVSVGFRLFK